MLLQKNVRKLSELCNGRENNLNIIRFIAAILVIYSHSFPFTRGQDCVDGLAKLTKGQMTLGGIAVSIFFFYGGFLICKSLERTQDGKKFFLARVKRIFPSLLVVVFGTVFVLGPILTTLSMKEYFTNSDTYKYLLNGLLFPVHNLPGVFEDNIYGPAVNGPLWTLPVEFVCYILCFVFWKLCFMNEKKAKYTIPVIIVFVVVASLTLARISPLLAEALRPSMLFYIGMIVYIYRDKIYVDIKFFLIAFVVFLLGLLTPVLNMFVYLTVPYILIYIGYGTKIKLQRFGGKYEVSYGMYLCGSPIQQTLVYLFDNKIPQISNAILSTIIAILFGWLLCILVEKPIQKLECKKTNAK